MRKIYKRYFKVSNINLEELLDRVNEELRDTDYSLFNVFFADGIFWAIICETYDEIIEE